ncbi:MAG TPA: GNAT family protein, partial [Dehalococcoidia bacterium]|nr:GNAT family protein [Dehalococcoidia bacterium]
MISECILEGDLVRLRPVEERDLRKFVSWLADPEVRYWLSLPEAPTLSSERQWLRDSREETDRLVWAIETGDGRLIGTIDLHYIDETEGRAQLGVAIQDKSEWSKGYGADAIRQVLKHAFTEVGLRRVGLTVDVDNVRAIRCYEKCGFQREGLLRAYRLREGQPVDALMMSVIRS